MTITEQIDEFNDTQPYRKGKENQDNRKEHKMPTNESERLSKKKKDAYEHLKHDENNNIAANHEENVYSK